jgi:hypothetical protein
MAAKKRLGSIKEGIDEDNSDELPVASQIKRGKRSERPSLILEAKLELLSDLKRAGGDSARPEFEEKLQTLLTNYEPSHFDPRRRVTKTSVDSCSSCLDPSKLEGVGISESKPVYPGCLGMNSKGEPMYKLGRMSFDMFRPTQLIVSIQGTFNVIDVVDGTDEKAVKYVPNSLLADVRHGKSPVRKYNIITAFTIEPWLPEFGEDSPNKEVLEPIKGIMTTYGFALSYPTQDRFSIWFTGGCIEASGDTEQWQKIFDKNHAPKRTFAESGKLLVASLLMGASASDEMNDKGTITYDLKRPIAGYIDLLYLDASLTIMRGNSGTIYVAGRLPLPNANTTIREPRRGISRFDSGSRPAGKITSPESGRGISRFDSGSRPEGNITSPESGRGISRFDSGSRPEGKIMSPESGRGISRFDSGSRPEGKIMSPESLKKMALPCKDNASLPSRLPIIPAIYHPSGGISRFDSLARSADKPRSPKSVMTPPTSSPLPDGRPMSPPSAKVAGPSLPPIRLISPTMSERKTKALLPPSQPVRLSSNDDSDFPLPTVEPSSPIFHIRPPPLSTNPSIEQDILIAPRRSKSPSFIRKRTVSPNSQSQTNTKPTKQGSPLAGPIPRSRCTSPVSTKATKHRAPPLPPIRVQSPGRKCAESSSITSLPSCRFQSPGRAQKAAPLVPQRLMSPF